MTDFFQLDNFKPAKKETYDILKLFVSSDKLAEYRHIFETTRNPSWHLVGRLARDITENHRAEAKGAS